MVTSTDRRAAVFLDRDGVLNEPIVLAGHPHPPRGVDELRVLPGVESACEQLRADGFVLVCITNQPDLARGTTSSAQVEAINESLQRQLHLDIVAVCPHDDHDRCPCRKPRPGLILSVAADMGIDLSRSVVVGDRWRDVEAGRRAGCATVFIDHHYRERRPDNPDAVANSLAEAVPMIIDLSRGTAGVPRE